MISIFSVFQRIFRFFIIFIVIISIRYMQTNLINWIFFSLFVINFAFIARQDNKGSTYKKCIISAKLINYYSAFILVMKYFFWHYSAYRSRHMHLYFNSLQAHLTITGYSWHFQQSMRIWTWLVSDIM
jgi:hypothetical protein